MAQPPGPPPPRLLDRVRAALRTRHCSLRTEKAYVGWIRRYIFFHDKRHPADMGAAEITQPERAGYPAQRRGVHAEPGPSALLFLYREVLSRSCRGSTSSAPRIPSDPGGADPKRYRVSSTRSTVRPGSGAAPHGAGLRL
jgi:hypothetical protein